MFLGKSELHAEAANLPGQFSKISTALLNSLLDSLESLIRKLPRERLLTCLFCYWHPLLFERGEGKFPLAVYIAVLLKLNFI